MPDLPPWLAACEAELHAAANEMIASGLPGPVLVQRERATDWGAQDYDAFINAAATNWSLFPDPPVADTDAADTDGLVLAVGRSMKFRVVMIPIACSPRDERAEVWFDKQKYWDPDELDAQSNGVSLTIHTDPSSALFTKVFVDRMRPIIDRCVASRPATHPTRICDPVPG